MSYVTDEYTQRMRTAYVEDLFKRAKVHVMNETIDAQIQRYVSLLYDTAHAKARIVDVLKSLGVTPSFADDIARDILKPPPDSETLCVPTERAPVRLAELSSVCRDLVERHRLGLGTSPIIEAIGDHLERYEREDRTASCGSG